MNNFRRKLLATAFFGASAYVPKYSWLAAISSEASAVEPVTIAIFTISTIITLMKAFSAPDGTMGSMLTAVLQNQSIIISNLQTIADSLNQLSAYVKQKQDELPLYLEADRLKGYFDTIRAEADGLILNLAAERNNPTASERASINQKYKLGQQKVQDTREKLAQYPNVFASVTIPLAMSLEVALDYKAGLPSFVPATLRNYVAWCKNVANPRISNSLASQLRDFSVQHDDVVQAMKSTSYGAARGTQPGVVAGGCFQTTFCWKTPGQCHPRRNSALDSGDVQKVAYRSAMGVDASQLYAQMQCDQDIEHFEPTVKLRLLESVEESLNADGVRLLKFSTKSESSFPEVCSSPPPNVNDCYVADGPQSAAVVENWIVTAQKPLSPWSDYVADAQKYSTLVDQLNSIRLAMASLSQALVVNQQCLDHANRQLRFLGVR